MQEQKREFKGIWIPKEIWLDDRLNALDKIILLEIDSLDNEETHCFASNEYLAEFCQCSIRKVSESISTLIKLDYLQMISFDGRTRILQSRLEKNARQISKNYEADTQKIPQNNINNNNINNNRWVKPTIDEIKAYCDERNNGINAEQFYDFYESKNWYVGKNKMKDWKACVRTWEQRGQRSNPMRVVPLPDWWDEEEKDYSNEEKNISEEDIEKFKKNIFEG